MGIVQGTFIYQGAPRNGATAKLWEASAFGAPPELDDPEPGGGQVGGDITTGIAYGGDGAYRWTAVPDDAYYVSCYYDAHRVWMYHHVEDIDALLATQGDLLVRGAANLEGLAIGVNGQVLTMVAGAPAWNDLTLIPTERIAPQVTGSHNNPGSWATQFTASIPDSAKTVIAVASCVKTTAATQKVQILYNAVQKAYGEESVGWYGPTCGWAGNGLGITADLDLQYDAGTYYAKGAAWSIA